MGQVHYLIKVQILQISVYVENASVQKKISRRAEVIKGLPDWYAIIRDEVTGKYIKRVQEESPTRGNMIVTGKTAPPALSVVITNRHSLGDVCRTLGIAGHCPEVRSGERGNCRIRLSA